MNQKDELLSRLVVLGKNGFLAKSILKQSKDLGMDCVGIGSSEVDLSDEASVEILQKYLRPQDVIIMTSAVTRDKGRDWPTFMYNLRMAENLCKVISKETLRQVIYISSDGVYREWDKTINEQSHCVSEDLYGVMHFSRERLLEDVCRAKKVPYAILRPCAIMGIEDSHQSYGPNRLIRSAIQKGAMQIFGEGEEIRDFISVEDVAELILKVILKKSVGILNLVSGDAISFRKLVDEIICIISEKEVTKSIQIQSMSRNGSITHRDFDCSAIQQAFPDFQPRSRTDVLRDILNSEMKFLDKNILRE